jgi:hypothetical protein
VPARPLRAPDAAGEVGLTGGVPYLGGDDAYELEKAAASAEMPGPVFWFPGPANGATPVVSGLGLFRWAEAKPAGGVPNAGWDGIGDASRAVASARGAEVPYDLVGTEPWGDGD